MPNFLDVLKKDLIVFTSRIDEWETKLGRNLKGNKRVTESDGECIVGEERAVETHQKSNTREKDIPYGGDPQDATRNKRKRPEIQVPSTKVKETATLAQRIEILNWYHANGGNQTRTAKHFDIVYPNLKIKQPLVSNWVKDELKWREEWENSNLNGSGHNAKRIRRVPLNTSSSPSVPVSSSPTLNDPTDLVVKAEKSDDLVAHQTINPVNADVHSILPKESGTITEAGIDDETSHAVIDSQEAHEHGTEGVGSNNLTPRDFTRRHRARPTPKEALQAALVLKRYLAAIDDPFARKMEADLDLFIDQIRLSEARRNLKPTLLTDYFPRK